MSFLDRPQKRRHRRRFETAAPDSRRSPSSGEVTLRVALLTAPLALALACGTPAEDPPPCDAPTASFTADGAEHVAGASAYCEAGARPAPAGTEGWTELFVAEGGAGDGSREAPFGSLTAAVDAAAGERAVIHLGPGTYDGASASGPLAVLGSGGAFTTIRGGLTASGTEALFLSHLSIDAEDRGVDASGVGRVVLEQVVVRGAAEVGVVAVAVRELELRQSTFQGQVQRNLVIFDTGLAMDRALIDGGEVGVQAATTETEPGTCTLSPVCPLRNYLYLDGSLIRGVGLAGVVAEHSQVRLRRSRVEGVVGGPGVHLIQSFVAATEDVQISGIDGPGMRLDSCRGHVEDATVDGSAGGVLVRRLDPDNLSLWYPGFEWYPDHAWRAPLAWQDPALFGDRYPGFEWMPPQDWYPGFEWLPGGEFLPEQLLEGMPNEALAPEITLYLWARLQLDGVGARDNSDYGMRIEGHATRVQDAEVTGTSGADSIGVLLFQRGRRRIDTVGASVVALSELDGVRVDGSEGVGAQVVRTVISIPFDEGEAVWDSRPTLTNFDVSNSGSVGMVALETGLHLEGARISGSAGAGLWLAGSVTTGSDLEILDTALGMVGGSEAGDGMLIQPGAEFGDDYFGTVTLTDLTIQRSARAGLFLADQDGQLRGTLRRGDGVVSDNGVEATRNGPLSDALELDGFDVVEDRGLDTPQIPE